jgi:lipid A ethanolaminephosphotransferase
VSIFSRLNQLFNKQLSSTLVALVSAFIFATLFNLKIWEIYFSNKPFQNFSDIFPVLFFFLFLYFLLFSLFSLFSFKWLQKIMLSLFFLVGSVSLYFSVSFNILFDVSMLQNVLETDFNEAADLITGTFLLVVLVLGIIPTVILYKLNISYKMMWKQLTQNALIVIVGFSLSLLSLFPYYGDFSSFVRNHNKQLSHSLLPSAPLYAFYKNMVNVSKELKIEKQIVDAKAMIRHPNNSQHTKPVALIVVIGETARASSFELNDAAKLEQPVNFIQREDLIYFKNFWSCGTNTALSVPCMFSVFAKDDYKREYNKKYENVAEILQRVGYAVSWTENNSGCKGICPKLNNVSIDPKQFAQYLHDDEFYDEALVVDLANQVRKQKNDQVVFLHQMGSHGPAYFKRAPKKFKKFQPACESSDFSDCSDEEIKNAYNNTVLYTKYVLSVAISQLQSISDEYDTALMYMSDHGESTGEKGFYLHGIPYFMAPEEQIHIPAILWMSEGFAESKMIDKNCIKNKANDKLSHDNLAHTLFGILDVDIDVFQPQLNMFNGCIAP